MLDCSCTVFTTKRTNVVVNLHVYRLNHKYKKLGALYAILRLIFLNYTVIN